MYSRNLQNRVDVGACTCNYYYNQSTATHQKKYLKQPIERIFRFNGENHLEYI